MERLVPKYKISIIIRLLFFVTNSGMGMLVNEISPKIKNVFIVVGNGRNEIIKNYLKGFLEKFQF